MPGKGKIIIGLINTSAFKPLNFNQLFFYDSSNRVVNPDSCVVSSKWPWLTAGMKYYNDIKYMSSGFPNIYASSSQDLNPTATFSFSDLSQVFRIVFYNRSDSYQDRILEYNMKYIYDVGTAKNAVFKFTSGLVQTFYTTPTTATNAATGGGGTVLLIVLCVGVFIFITMVILYLLYKKYGRGRR